MNFTELKRWARSHGYDVLKEKWTETCIWTKIDDPCITGLADSFRDTATQIYNDITEGVWVSYQEEYKKNKEVKWQ